LNKACLIIGQRRREQGLSVGGNAERLGQLFQAVGMSGGEQDSDYGKEHGSKSERTQGGSPIRSGRFAEVRDQRLQSLEDRPRKRAFEQRGDGEERERNAEDGASHSDAGEEQLRDGEQRGYEHREETAEEDGCFPARTGPPQMKRQISDDHADQRH